MTAPAVTNTFSNGTTADASQVNTNFSDLVTYITNRNDGSSTWDRLLVTSSSAVPLIVNNSTGTANIANFQDNGTNVFQILDGGDVIMNTTKKFYIDSGGDTFLYESSANVMDFFGGGSLKLRLAATQVNVASGIDLTIPATQKIYLDGGNDTFLTESAGDTLDIATGGVVALQITSGQILDYKLAAVALGAGGDGTLGATGGSGPSTTTQNAWIRVKIAGTDSYIPFWR
jgi:hypothetical protein